MKIHIDFETYSELDIKKVGAWKYSTHPSTKVICTAIGVDSLEPVLYTDADEVKQIIEHYFTDGNTHEFFAFNSFFECCIINNVLKLAIETFDHWNDVMAWSAASALPLNLGDCSRVLFPKNVDLQKDKEGKSLIAKLCSPQRITIKQLSLNEQWRQENPEGDEDMAEFTTIDKTFKHHKKQKTLSTRGGKLVSARRKELLAKYADVKVHPRIKHDNYGELMYRMGEYCIQDVVVERNISHTIRPLQPNEKKVWVQDQRINWRGIKCDVDFCERALKVFVDAKAEQTEEMREITGVANPNSIPQLTEWLSMYIDVPNLQAPTVREMLEQDDLPPNVRKVLELRSSTARTPPKKYLAMLRRVDELDHRMREMIGYHTATTGRWSSRGINVQNLPRPDLDAFEDAIRLIQEGKLQLLQLCHGNKIDVICSLIRTALIASEGNLLTISDYASIEARVLAWLAGEKDILEVFNTHGKLYEYTAAKVYRKPLASITKEERFVGKTCFTKETKILTDKGVVSLSELTTKHLLWDGKEWIKHQGTIYMGMKNCISKAGIQGTSDHKFWAGDKWVTWSEALAQKHVYQQVLNTASLPSLDTTDTKLNRQVKIGGGDQLLNVLAVGRAWFTQLISDTKKQRGVTRAENLNQALNGGGSTHKQCLTMNTEEDFATEFLPLSLGVTIKRIKCTLTTAAEELLCAMSGAITKPVFSLTCRLLRGGMMPINKWTEPTITWVMNQVISDSLPHQKMHSISDKSEKCRKESVNLRHVYDIVNAGPRNRFTVISDDGPMIASNCALALGYQGGFMAFLRMAKNYGVDIPEDLARTTVKKWRKANRSTVKFWYDCQKAAVKAILRPGKVFHVNKHIQFKCGEFGGHTYLWCRLPSGRLLSYFNPKLEQGKFGNKITFWAINSETRQWAKSDTYGGKLVENITQAVARDILAEAKLRVVGTPFDNIVLSVHDELVCDTPKDVADEKALSEIMCVLPEWAAGLPVAAKGEETLRYWK